MRESYSRADKEFLLKLARDSIREWMLNHEAVRIDDRKISKKLKEPRAVFVTLTINSELRGCIGSMEPEGVALYKNVAANAVNAAFRDTRFCPLERSELDSVDIEISVLSPLRRLKYQSLVKLFKYLCKDKPGVYIKKGFFGATYLPQVWEHFKTAEEFLSSLCEKAGLDSREWEKGRLEVWIYDVKCFK